MQRTVLVADDNKLARIVASKALAKIRRNWACIEGGGSNQAIAAVQSQDVDISLIDLNMPGDGSLILAADLRRKRPNMLRLRKVAQ